MSAPDPSAWMHIDSAPRDGTRVWLRLDTGAGPMEYIGSKHPDPNPRSGWNIEPNGYWVSVTHWQPIPNSSQIAVSSADHAQTEPAARSGEKSAATNPKGDA